jgi:hypothetical protein
VRVEDWNETYAGEETRRFELVGEHEFIRMERPA